MFSDSGELIVPTSRTKLALVALGGIAFVAVGMWLLGRAQSPVLHRVIGALSVAFFGLCAVYAIWRLLRPTPALVINRDGILDNASAVAVGFLAWQDIAELREYTFNGQTFLGIVPKDVNAVLQKQPAWRRSAIRANLALGALPVNIPQTVLPLPVSELLHHIDKRFRR